MTRPNTVCVYCGPSELQPDTAVIALVSGLTRLSANPKTGAMVQTWILLADTAPHTAARTGKDSAVCGDCPLRPSVAKHGTKCYVNTWQAPLALWRAYRYGAIPHVSPEAIAQLIAGRGLRLGSYGDPAAVPFNVWSVLASRAEYVTGYSHAWRSPAAQSLRRYCMASVESIADARAAHAMGWRTFRVRARGSAPRIRGIEAQCPASAEAGRVLTCARCRACGGLSSTHSASIVIDAH